MSVHIAIGGGEEDAADHACAALLLPKIVPTLAAADISALALLLNGFLGDGVAKASAGALKRYTKTKTAREDK
jgi:hypothetical protein